MGVTVTPSVPVKANSGVRARVPAAGKVLEGDDKPTLSALYYDSTDTSSEFAALLLEYTQLKTLWNLTLMWSAEHMGRLAETQ